MVDEQEGQTGHAEMLMEAGDVASDMTAIVIGVRTQLAEAGFAPEAADAGALQFQGFLLATAAESHKASLQPRKGGIFG